MTTHDQFDEFADVVTPQSPRYPAGQHTPGPWTIVKESNDAIIRYSDGELVSYVARIYDTALCAEHGTIDANARLIAAAPEMRVFVERAGRLFAEMLDGATPDSGILAEWLDASRALLARIEEGKS